MAEPKVAKICAGAPALNNMLLLRMCLMPVAPVVLLEIRPSGRADSFCLSLLELLGRKSLNR